MYYKIENKLCTVYEKLYQMRLREHEMENQNKAMIKKRTGLTWKKFLGYPGQQTFNRVTQFCAFEFNDPKKVDLSVWRPNKTYPNMFEPNVKTKAGREMQLFLSNGLHGNSFYNVLGALNIKRDLSRFTLPFVEIAGDVLILYLDNNHQPKNKNVIEITSVEFNKLHRKSGIKSIKLLSTEKTR